MMATALRAAVLGGAFSPLSLSPVLWLQADGVLWQNSARTTPAVADADPVGCWDDASVNGNNVTQGTSSKKPTLRLGVQNGRNVVRFDGIDDFLGLILGASVAQPVTIFCVAKYDADGVNVTLYDFNPNAKLCVRTVGGVSSVSFGDAASAKTLAAGNFGLAFGLHVGVANGASSSTRLNGADVTPVGDADVQPAARFVFGQRGDEAGANVAACTIAETLVYGSLLNSRQVHLVESYLNARWGIY